MVWIIGKECKTYCGNNKALEQQKTPQQRGFLLLAAISDCPGISTNYLAARVPTTSISTRRFLA
jgi:hypothetical protein